MIEDAEERAAFIAEVSKLLAQELAALPFLRDLAAQARAQVIDSEEYIVAARFLVERQEREAAEVSR